MSENDWGLVSEAWKKVVSHHWNPTVKLFAEPKELRKYGGRKIDNALRRLLDSEKYSSRIRLYGGPSHLTPRNPFRWNNRNWSLIRIEIKEEVS